MDTSKISEMELEAMKFLVAFYLKINDGESAMRAVKAVRALAPDDLWVRGMYVRCCDRLREYAEVLSLTEDLSLFEGLPEIKKALQFLRARALMKLGREEESRQYVEKLAE